MSHSRIFDEYAKIMTAKGLLKTADKKDTDYNTVPDKAGPDTKLDETGYELVEIAHPEQIQVAESRLNDGIVENGVEIQKTMIEVALRNPRGVLADLMKTLVKAANILEEDMTEGSLRLAKEVDDFLVVLAQQSQVVLSPEAAKKADEHRLVRLRAAVKETLNRFADLDWSTLGFGGAGWFGGEDGKMAAAYVSDATKKLEEFAGLADEDALKSAHALAEYVNQFYKIIRAAIQKSKDWGDDQQEAIIAWDDLKSESDEWLAKGRAPDSKTQPEQTAPGVASQHAKAPNQTYITSPQVKELQGLLGVKQDSKFGPRTFEALKEKATTNSLLENLMTSKPKSYIGWTNSDVGEALNRIADGKASAEQAQKAEKSAPSVKLKDDLLEPY